MTEHSLVLWIGVFVGAICGIMCFMLGFGIGMAVERSKKDRIYKDDHI